MEYFSETWKSPFFALEAIGQKMAIFKSHQNTPCGYSKLVPEDVWQDAKGFRAIWSFNPEKTSKMWWKLAILDVFSGWNDQIDLNPFASCQASSGTSLEYQHGVFWWYLKIAIFCPVALRAKNTQCGYSKLVPEDAWQDSKGFSSIWSFHPEKTSKMAQNGQFSPHFGRFLRTEWLELAWFIFWKKT